MIPLCQNLNGTSPPRINKDFKEVVSQNGDWFVEESFSYIRIYGSEVGPHVLRKFITDKSTI